MFPPAVHKEFRILYSHHLLSGVLDHSHRSGGDVVSICISSHLYFLNVEEELGLPGFSDFSDHLSGLTGKEAATGKEVH